jgi:hypothetical protein
MSPPITATRARRAIASIAAVPSLIKRVALSRALASSIVAIALAAISLAAAGCGGDNEGEGDIPATEAATLLGQLEEVQANVDVGSCFVAADETEILISEIEDLPDEVDADLRRALENGAEQLQVLLQDPDQCERPTTTEETTTEETTTEEETTEEETKTRETTTEPTTPTQTQTETAPTTGDSGGVGPDGAGQGGL